MPRLLLLLITLGLVASVGAAPAAARSSIKTPSRPATIAIADQHGETFSDPLFAALGVKHARLNFAWDALQYDWQVVELDKWMQSAHAAGVEPLVIFSQSRVKGRTRMLPTPSEYAEVVRGVRARYPFVREFAGWNEANHSGQPTYKRPDRVAQFYKVLRTECRGCRVLPASLLDNPNIVPWTRTLRGHIRRLRQPDPRLWGLHNYSDVNRLRDTSTRKLLRAVKGKVWITESGGVVAATSPTASKFPQGAPYAARVARYITGPLITRNPRIQRIYVYDWKAQPGPVSWDSGLLSADGVPRPAYKVLKSYIARGARAAGALRTGGADLPVRLGGTAPDLTSRVGAFGAD